MARLFDKVTNSGTKIRVKPPFFGYVINFSNTRDNWFALTIEQLISVLSDIQNNLADYKNNAGINYDESAYRTVFDRTLTDDVARALSTVQTLPLFTLLAEIIHFSTTDSAYTYKTIDLDPSRISAAIAQLQLMKKAGPSAISAAKTGPRLTGGQNLIYYGAPGTGKSYALEKKAGSATIIRTVFHPDMQNSDFFGTLKPVTSEAGKISYAFSPGAFSRALAHAIAHPAEPVWLIVEELNRAPAAAVFGDLFLLLDRDRDGTGEYDVDCPSEEAARWYENNTGIANGKLRLPSNLWIVATMNSADQGVYPLDTAFRRRWQQSYIPLDYSKGPDAEIELALPGDEDTLKISWLDFVRRLNGFLITNADVAEDRLVGPWFVKPSEFNKDGKISGKVLIYLWDDIFRTHGRDIVFDMARLKTYGDLSKAVENGEAIFSEPLITALTA